MGYKWFWIVLERLGLIGIEPHEVVQALSAGRKLPAPIRLRSGLPALAITSRTRFGRVLVIVVRPEWPDSTILDVREPTELELARFEEWEKGGEGDE